MARKPKRKSAQTSFKFRGGGSSSRIDDSHQPFKRIRQIGPGPKRRPAVAQVRDWECKRGPKKYTQICTYVGPNRARRGTKVVSKLDPKKKKKYNKQYRAWRASLSARARPDLRRSAPLPGYRCRRTPVAKCK